MTLFYLNKGFSLCMSFSPDTTKTATAQEKLQICSATEIARIMNRILSVTHDNLTKVQSNMIRQVNHQCHLKDFAVENEVMVNIWNFVSNQPTKTLNDKRCGSFRILQQFHSFYKILSVESKDHKNWTTPFDEPNRGQITLLHTQNPIQQQATLQQQYCDHHHITKVWSHPINKRKTKACWGWPVRQSQATKTAA